MTIITPALIALCVLVFLVQQVQMNAALAVREGVGGQIMNGLTFRFALKPGDLFWWPTLFSYAFLHASWLHLLGNMLVLWIFGPSVEDRLGRIGFTVFYLIGGAVAGGAHLLLDPSPVIGASGAVAAVTGAYLVLFPITQVRCLVLFIVIGIYEIPAWVFIVLAVAKDVWSTGFGGAGNVATLAHLGGYAYGIVIAMLLLATHILGREHYDLFSMGKHAARRSQFRAAAQEFESRQRRRVGKPADDPDSDAVASARAAIAERIAAHDLPGAADLYAKMVERFPAMPSGSVLASRYQIDLANHLFAAQRHALAALAYERFAQTYPSDPQTPRVRLMLALVAIRYTREAARARVVIEGLREKIAAAEDRALLDELVSELAAITPPGQ